MRIVCAWCGKPQGEKEPLKDTGTTHTICPECLENNFGKSSKAVDDTHSDRVEQAIKHLTVKEVSGRLGISARRVRQLLKSRSVGEQLSDSTWVLTEDDTKKLEVRRNGRPSKLVSLVEVAQNIVAKPIDT